MATITPPDDNWQTAEWRLLRPAQINRAAYSGARQVVGQPGQARWEVAAAHAPIVGEASARAWRAFFAKLKGPVNTFPMRAAETAQTSFAFPYTGGPGTFTNLTGTSVVGRTITKTDAAAAWTASAHTTGGSSGGARLVFRAGQTNADLMMGLNDAPTLDAGYAGIRAALNPQSNGRLRIFELNVDKGDFGPYSAEDVLAVLYNDSTDKWEYYRGGELLRRETAPSGLTLFGDTSFYTQGGQALDVYFSSNASAYGVAAGDTSLPIAGHAAGSAVISAGMMVTALLEGGGAQLLAVPDDVVADGSGDATFSFDTPLRGVPYALATRWPFALVALDGDAGWNVSPGQLYQFGIEASEAF